MSDEVKQVAGTAKQTGHNVPYRSPHPDQARKDNEQNAQHNRDMARVEQMHERRQRK